MGIQNIGLTKGHIHRLLPAEITEFPLSGVKTPPLALHRPLVLDGDSIWQGATSLTSNRLVLR